MKFISFRFSFVFSSWASKHARCMQFLFFGHAGKKEILLVYFV